MAVWHLPLKDRAETASADQNGSIEFIGTATVLVRIAGYTLLTDPNFIHRGEHVHLGFGLFSKRLTEPARSIGQLPPIDLVLVSHLHADHFDRVALTQLDRTLPIICPPEAADSLQRKRFRKATGLPTWDRIRVVKRGCEPLMITALPGRHGPGAISTWLPSVMGSLIEVGETRPFRLYISGDTLIHDDLKQIPLRAPEIDIALLHLGGTRVFGILLTMDARQGWEALRILKPEIAVPIHYNDYTVFKSPLQDFKDIVERAGWGKKVRYLRPGERLQFDYEHAGVASAQRGA